MPTIDRDGTVLWYETLGREDAPPVVLLHDAGADLRAWRPAARYLAADYWLLMMDLRGHGLSEWQTKSPAMDLSAYVADVAAVLDELGIALCAVAGMGFGALVALRMAIEEPQRIAAIVATGRLDGVLKLGDGKVEVRSEEAVALARYGAPAYGKRRAATVGDSYLRAGVAALYRDVQTDGVVSALASMAPSRLDAEDLTMLRTPIMVGTGDRGAGNVAGDRLAELLPGTWRVQIRDAGDDAAVTQAGAFAGQMARFFGAVEQGLPTDNRGTV